MTEGGRCECLEQTLAPNAGQSTPRLRWSRDQALEAVLLLLFLLFISQAVFGELSSTLVNSYPIAYLCVPILVWTAFRFSQRETATAIFVLSGIATWGTLLGFGPFARDTQHESLLLLQTFMGSTALMAMAFSAVVSERKRAEVARLMGNISHDVKNLLMPVVCGAGLLQGEINDLLGRLPGLLPLIQGDERRLYNMFYNLVNNAIPEVDAGGSITVFGREEPADGMLLISVADTGY